MLGRGTSRATDPSSVQMGVRCLALLAVPVLLAGCADLVTPVAHSARAEPTYVRIRVSPRDVHGSISLHDAIRYIHIAGAEADIQKQLEPDADMRVRLPAAGEYTLTSWTRTCGDTCNTLHRPSGRCSATFLAVEGQVTPVEIRFRIGRDCTVTVSD